MKRKILAGLLGIAASVGGAYVPSRDVQESPRACYATSVGSDIERDPLENRSSKREPSSHINYFSRYMPLALLLGGFILAQGSQKEKRKD